MELKRYYNISFLFSVLFLGLWILMAVLAALISNDKPLFLKSEKGWSSPILTGENDRDYKEYQYDFVIWPPVPFSSGSIDLQNAGSKAPGAVEKRKAGNFRHILGTDHLGRDVLAGLINGALLSFEIIILTILLAALIGILSGPFMGFYGDNCIKISSAVLLLFIFIFAVLTFHFFVVQENYFKSIFIWIASGTIIYFLTIKLFSKRMKYITIPIDMILSRFIEIFDSIPKILLLIAIFAGFNPSVEKVILLIALISWPEIAKLTRAEALKEKNKYYIEAGRVLGFTDLRLILIHILPNIIAPILVYLSFFAGYILIAEASLSFLGLGVPPDVMTWGRMLAMSKNQLSAWWLVFFPGFFIFATVYSLNTLGRYLSVKIQKQKQAHLLI